VDGRVKPGHDDLVLPGQFLYFFFMRFEPIPCRVFMRKRAHHAVKGWCAMGDAVAVIYGIFVFVLLILYVKGCEKV